MIETTTLVTKAGKVLGKLAIDAAGHFANEWAKTAGKRSAMPKDVPYSEQLKASVTTDIAHGAVSLGFACATEFLRGGIRYYWAKQARRDQEQKTA